MFSRAILLFCCLSLGCFGQNPTLLVLAKQANQLLFIDPDSGKTLATVTVGRGPHEITLATDGKKAYVANYGDQTPGSSLSVIDVTARKEVKRIDLSPLRRPHGLFALADTIFLTAEMNRLVARIDTKTDALDWMMGTGQAGTHMVVGSADGKTIFTANIPSNTVSRIDLTRGGGAAPDAITVANVPKMPEGIALSPDGTELWVGSNGEGVISVLDSASLSVKETLHGHKVPIRVRFTSDGKRAIVSDPEANEVTVYDASTRKEIKRLKTDGAPVGSVISKDGKWAYVACIAANKVAVIGLEKLEVAKWIDAPGGPDGIALLE